LPLKNKVARGLYFFPPLGEMFIMDNISNFGNIVSLGKSS